MKKIALITGAGAGIGFQIVKSIRNKIDVLLLLDKNINALSKLTERSKLDNVISYCVDLGDLLSVEKFIKTLKKNHLYPNILINNAGYGGSFEEVENVSLEQWDCVFNINVKSQFLLMKAFLPEMKKNKYGRIVNIASVQGFLGANKSSAYVASKHAALGLMKTVAVEAGEYGITFNSVSPCYVKTKMGVQDDLISSHYEKIISKTPAKRIAEPSEISSLVDFLISKNAGFINGENIVVDGGLTAGVGTQ